MLDNSIDTKRAVSVKLLNGANDNMAVDGSVTPVIFEAKPPAGKKWRIIRILGYLEGLTVFSAELFADLPALVNGVEAKIAGDTVTVWKTNRDLALEMHHLDAPVALGRQDRTLAGKWDLKQAFGSSILVDENGGVQFIVKDDLSSIVAFYVTVQGQMV